LSIACALITSLENGLSYWAAVSNIVYMVLIAYLLSRLKCAMNQNKRLLRTDGITGLANRNSFYDLAGREMSRSRRYLHPFTVAYLDIDNLKMVNYRFGYKRGDELLRLVAETIHNNIRDVDVVSRLGGDEFALLLPETGAEGAQVVLSRLKNKLLENAARKDLVVTFSFGATTFLKSPDSVEDLIKRALVQMYSAKNSGANSIDQDVFGSE
jgi:diguanylate cyclase (GGDEF)-like protein